MRGIKEYEVDISIEKIITKRVYANSENEAIKAVEDKVVFLEPDYTQILASCANEVEDEID